MDKPERIYRLNIRNLATLRAAAASLSQESNLTCSFQQIRISDLSDCCDQEGGDAIDSFIHWLNIRISGVEQCHLSFLLFESTPETIACKFLTQLLFSSIGVIAFESKQQVGCGSRLVASLSQCLSRLDQSLLKEISLKGAHISLDGFGQICASLSRDQCGLSKLSLQTSSESTTDTCAMTEETAESIAQLLPQRLSELSLDGVRFPGNSLASFLTIATHRCSEMSMVVFSNCATIGEHSALMGVSATTPTSPFPQLTTLTRMTHSLKSLKFEGKSTFNATYLTRFLQSCLSQVPGLDTLSLGNTPMSSEHKHQLVEGLKKGHVSKVKYEALLQSQMMRSLPSGFCARVKLESEDQEILRVQRLVNSPGFHRVMFLMQGRLRSPLLGMLPEELVKRIVMQLDVDRQSW